MSGPKIFNRGLRRSMPLTANGERQAPPPIPIVRNESEMMRALQAEFAAVERGEKTCCIVVAKPRSAEGVSEAEILAVAGERFSRNLRPYDGLFAFGVNRYLMSLAYIKPEDTLSVMNRLRMRIADAPLVVAGGGLTRVAVSIGGAMIDPTMSLRNNIDRADQARIQAWHDGGESVRLWSPDIDVT